MSKMESGESEIPWESIAASLSMDETSRKNLSRILRDAGEETVNLLLDEVDQSDYSLDDWAEALDAFEGWLTEQKAQSRPLDEMIGYVHCCTLTNAPGIPLASLKVIVSQALIDFGFESIS